MAVRGTKQAQAAVSGDGRPLGDGKVRVAIIGVGNCASSLVQGVHYYRDADPSQFVPGLMHVDLGGYHVRDIEFTAAFEINKTKVGKDLSEAIFSHPNNTIRFADVPGLGARVWRGMTHDGIGKYLADVIQKAPGPTDDVVGILQDTRTDVVANFLPVGSEEATKWYTEQEWAYLRLEGSTSGDLPLNLELKLEVWDSPNSAGIVIDAVRLAKLGLDHGLAGALEGPSAYLMKAPPRQLPDDDAHEAVEEFIRRYSRAPRPRRAKRPA